MHKGPKDSAGSLQTLVRLALRAISSPQMPLHGLTEISEGHYGLLGYYPSGGAGGHSLKLYLAPRGYLECLGLLKGVEALPEALPSVLEFHTPASGYLAVPLVSENCHVRASSY